MTLAFEPVTLERQADYRRILAACEQTASDYSFVNIWSWALEHGMQWAWDDGLVWLRQTLPETGYWAPVGAWDRPDWERLLTGIGGPFIRVPQALAERWQAQMPAGLTVEESRGHWDYLYAVEDLAGLRGNRFHKKKNLLNQFRKKYAYRYLELGPQLVSRALAMQTDWCTWRDCEAVDTLAAENRAIERTLSNWDRLTGLSGGALVVGDRMAAYTVAEALTDDTVLIHFEKGDPEYRGAYQAINQMFAAGIGEPARLVNREQDLDDEGLRKAKLSYNPVDFIRKFRVTVG